MRDTVTIFVPAGYANSTEFLDDCGFESLSVGAEDVAAFNDGYAAGLEDREEKVTTGDLFNQLLARINFDGMDPRTFSLAELHGAIEGAEWPKCRSPAVIATHCVTPEAE